ncbi:ZZ-type zinc finger-containing protein P35G2.11c-like [Anoplophora glabripennis]|uniref:ZZ-type zinc finger-containing protein P35G2.11c-like n=1 Tax=Anoplophora glabripennis TaxID=217634 RepID=UPI00087592AA|nr:ZZ-type zinc finger-containing protein P35G2.11c-like [Anoplophora glabripennis]
MFKLGLRVIRAPDWSLKEEDGGENYTGTLYQVNNADKTAIVQWDNGNQTLYKIGQNGTYELLIIDNAQIGIRHKRIQCNICSSDGIRGPRYKCNNCSNYDLCDLCYLRREHNPSHSFKRIEPPITKETDLSSLPGSSNQEDTMNIGTVCDGCNFPDIRDVRYKCINCYNYNLCDFCYRGNIHDLSHRFSRIDSPNGPRTDLPPRLTSRTNQAQGSVHDGIQCDECKSLDILGIRYKCKSCRNYDLCDPCYRGNAHDLSHCFIRIDSPNCVGIYLPPRLVTMTKQKLGTVHKNIECNACHYINIRGIRYKCKDCRDYDLCVFCYHGNKHDLSHRFSRIDSLNCVGIDLIPRSTSRSNQKQDSVHRRIQCDECNIFNIRGIRYKCNICRNYDLCERCYNANKHDVHHNFKRLDCPNSVGVILPPRVTSRRDNGAEGNLFY